jgi:hypothetical protein
MTILERCLRNKHLHLQIETGKPTTTLQLVVVEVVELVVMCRPTFFTHR